MDLERLVRPLLDPLHELQVHQGLAVNPDELLRRQPVLPVPEAPGHPAAGSVGSGHHGRVTRRGDAHDLAHPEKAGPAVDRQEHEVAVLQPSHRVLLSGVLLETRDRRREPRRSDRFEQVVQRVHVEGAQGVVVVRGHEHDPGRHRGASEEIEPRFARHLDVEEDDVRLLPGEMSRRLAHARRLSAHFDFGMHRQQRAQLLPRQALVVHDQRRQAIPAHVATPSTSSIRARTQPSSCPTSNRWRPG
jgi:hypothetical protein